MRDSPGRLVLLGHPVRHSLSPALHNAALRRLKLPLSYEALDVPPHLLDAAADALLAARAAGNVTIPHKERFLALCARRTPIADRVGATNTFWTEGDALVADNTDVGGFDRAARALLPGEPRALRVAVIGAGGGAAAVLAAVEGWPECRASVWSRCAARASVLVARFPDVARAETRLARAVVAADLVVNATPIGMESNELPVDPELLRGDAAAMDLVYRRGGTRWVRALRAGGRRASDGMPMLVAQAALAFERWFGVQPDVESMWSAVR